MLIKKLDSLRKKNCTVQLYNKLKKEFKIDGFDHDILINDEYTDVQHVKTINVRKDPVKQDDYVVSYIDSTLSPSYQPVEKKVILYVTVAKEDNNTKLHLFDNSPTSLSLAQRNLRPEQMQQAGKSCAG